LLAPALVLFAALVALGTWQLQRKAWKEALIATLNERLAAAPAPLPAPDTWPQLDRQSDEYRRVKFAATFEPGQSALVLATTSALRPDVPGLGFWVFAPARLADGSVVVINRGFVPAPSGDPKVSYDGPAAGVVEITGALRWAEARHWFTPRDNPAQNIWYVRDPAMLAAAKNWGSSAVAPFYVEQESPPPRDRWPQPGKLVVNLPNNHLQYVVTWYGLALVLVVVFAVWAFKSRA
jgi:surfeit locus 1 family protein